jgi:hypothetical protein
MNPHTSWRAILSPPNRVETATASIRGIQAVPHVEPSFAFAAAEDRREAAQPVDALSSSATTGSRFLVWRPREPPPILRLQRVVA